MHKVADKSLLESIGQAVDISSARIGIEAVLKDSSLDWTIQQENVHSPHGIIPGAYANYRSDNNEFLGLVGTRYRVLNNIDAFRFIDDLEDFTYSRAGMYKSGRQVFIVGKSSNKVEITPDDYIEEYLTFLHGHDGKSGIRLFISPIRIHCCNQLNLLVRTSSFSYSIAHRGNLKEKLVEARKAILQGNKYLIDLQHRLQALNNSLLKVPPQTIIEKLIPIPPNLKETSIKTYNRRIHIRETILDLYNNKPDNQNYKGTKFGLLNAVSDYISHQTPSRTRIDTDRTNLFMHTIQNNTLLNQAYNILLTAA